ncbi:MAG: DUF1667 domain-containing protein [Clostridia bacterium]|nr:DUF1667 domain-containing protein [Clostridia bacterium]
MTERELTCIVCPMGCGIKVVLDGNEVVSVSGNTCPRGEAYAKTECVNPVRVITSTVRCDNGEVLPVKTAQPIPKEKIGECMKIINSHIAHLPVSVGDVIIENVFGTDIVATQNMTERE